MIYYFFQDLSDRHSRERLQLVVPLFLTSKILKEVHEGVGHLSVHKTVDMLQNQF